MYEWLSKHDFIANNKNDNFVGWKQKGEHENT